MINIKKSRQKQQGFLMIVAVILIVVFAAIAVVATYLVNNDRLSATNQLGSQQAFYITEAGLESGVHQLMIPTIASRTTCATVTGNANLTNYTFTGAKGPFTVTGTGPQSPTSSTLSSAISASDTTVPVANIATYATTGRIMIDKELIDYATISGNSFINVRRGVAGTTAVTHDSGAPVGQYQCLLQSQGGVPTLSPAGSVIGGGARTIQEAVQLPEAWAVANGTANTINIIHWNKPTEVTWNNASVSGVNRDMNSIFVLSYADAWTVGSNGVFLHWNGSAWTTVASGDTSAYFGVTCVAHNNCWAVGAARSFNFWNGSTWTEQTTTVSTLPNVRYNSVYCVASNDCWAVGNTSGGDVFVHWNGTNWTRDASAPTPAANLNSVWCTATNNCWAFGASRTAVRWNGSAWSDFPITSLPNVTYNDVTCVNANDCWAVGNNSGGSVTVHWDGSAWTRVTAALSVNLNGIGCSKTDSCWAVGASSTTLYWNGTVWTDIANPLGNIILNSVGEIGAATQPESAWQEQFP